MRVFNRHGIEKDERAMAIEREEIETLAKDRDDEQSILDRNVYGRLADMLRDNDCGQMDQRGSIKATKSPQKPCLKWCRKARNGGMFAVKDEKLHGKIEALRNQYDESKSQLEALFDGQG